MYSDNIMMMMMVMSVGRVPSDVAVVGGVGSGIVGKCDEV